MRGTAYHPDYSRIIIRFIPAHAGNSGSGYTAPSPPAVHPRACGEQVLMVADDPAIGGSSPRMRGTVSNSSLGIALPRFIPAHAGNRDAAVPK